MNGGTYLLAKMIGVGEGVLVVGRGRVGHWVYTAVSSPFVTLSLCNSRWGERLLWTVPAGPVRSGGRPNTSSSFEEMLECEGVRDNPCVECGADLLQLEL